MGAGATLTFKYCTAEKGGGSDHARTRHPPPRAHVRAPRTVSSGGAVCGKFSRLLSNVSRLPFASLEKCHSGFHPSSDVVNIPALILLLPPLPPHTPPLGFICQFEAFMGRGLIWSLKAPRPRVCSVSALLFSHCFPDPGRRVYFIAPPGCGEGNEINNSAAPPCPCEAQSDGTSAP